MGGGVKGSKGGGGDSDEGRVKRRRLVVEAENEENSGIRDFFFFLGGERKKFSVHCMRHGVSMHPALRFVRCVVHLPLDHLVCGAPYFI